MNLGLRCRRYPRRHCPTRGCWRSGCCTGRKSARRGAGGWGGWRSARWWQSGVRGSCSRTMRCSLRTPCDLAVRLAEDKALVASAKDQQEVRWLVIFVRLARWWRDPVQGDSATAVMYLLAPSDCRHCPLLLLEAIRLWNDGTEYGRLSFCLLVHECWV